LKDNILVTVLLVLSLANNLHGQSVLDSILYIEITCVFCLMCVENSRPLMEGICVDIYLQGY